MNDKLSTEELVLEAVRNGISKALEQQMTGYGNPVAKIAEAILNQHAEAIREILNDAVATAFNSKTVREFVKSEFQRKVAKILVSKLEGETEKRVSELRADPVMRAKITLAVQQAIQPA